MSGLKIKVLEAPIFDGVAQDLVLKSNNVNRIVIANTGSVSIQSNLSYSGTLTGNTGIINIGSGQIYKDESGNVGIGTSTPIYKLHVSDSTSANANTDIIGIKSNYFTNAKKSLTWFSGTDAVGRISTVYNTISGEVGIDMTFGSLYNLTAGMNDSELMRLTSAGRLGIGTPLPGAKLEVRGNIHARVTNDILDMGVVSGVSYIQGYNNVSGIAAIPLAFYTGTAERMRINSDGNVGIGSTSPVTAIEIIKATPIITLTPSAYSGNYRTTLGTRSGAEGFLIFGNNNQNEIRAGRTAVGGYLDFFTNNTVGQESASDGVLVMRMTSSGLVGINTSSPNASYKLDVAGNILAQGSLRVEGSNIRASGGGSAAVPSIQPGEDSDTGMYWGGTNTIGFSTGGTRRAEITSEGVLLTFANSSANYGIYMVNANASPLGIRSTYTGAAPNGTGNLFYLASDTAGTKFTVRSNGGIANFQANDANLSDRREKKDFTPCGDYLEKLCQIPVQKFRYINQAADDDGLSIGVVAQDVQEILPELVSESDWSNGVEGSEPKMRLSIYQTDLQYVMMRAIQEQQEIIKSLKAEFDAYKDSHP